MHQIPQFQHPKGQGCVFFLWRLEKSGKVKRNAMVSPKRNQRTGVHPCLSHAFTIVALALGLALAIQPLRAQSAGTQTQSQPPANPQPAQDIPDAPSTVQPPVPKPAFPPPDAASTPAPQAEEGSSSSSAAQTDDGQKPAPPPMPPIETITPGQAPRNLINPKENLFTISVTANFVQIPVMVKDADGRRVDGLLPKDFSVYENDKKQDLTYFTSDPYLLSVAILLDTGMADVALQKINQTYSALVGAFSPYDEVALYTYSSTVSQVTGFTGRPEKLTAVLNEMKLVRGRNSGPPVMDGPFSGGPTVNGAPVGGPTIQPVNTPPREYHVLNDAILRAAVDLGKRDRTRRKIIFVISDGRDMGSQASYRDVLKVLESRDIQVKAVTVDTGALPALSAGREDSISRSRGATTSFPSTSSPRVGDKTIPPLRPAELKRLMRASPTRPGTSMRWATARRPQPAGRPTAASRSWSTRKG